MGKPCKHSASAVLMLLCLLLLLSLISPAGADALQPPSISLDEYAYPYPVDYLTVTVEKQELRMAVIIRAMFETGAVR